MKTIYIHMILLIKALFRSKNFLDFDTVALSFLFDNHYPIM